MTHDPTRRELPRVLLVEDDDDIRLDLAELLEAEGFSVTCAAHGQDALSVLQAGPAPDVILLDLMMPTMDGWAFRAAQLADATIASIPVLLLTAGGVGETESLRVSGCIKKPIHLDRLFAELRRVAEPPQP